MNQFDQFNHFTVQEKADYVLDLLKKDYPTVETPLIHENEFQLLIAVVLSPQTKDETTNMVTPQLFAQYPDVYAFAQANIETIAEIIRPINYYKTKAKRLVDLSNMLIERFDAQVPSTMEALLQLPGVGRKVANVLINEWFVYHAEQNDVTEEVEPEGFVVDTHVLRVSKRLGLTEHTDPKKVEQDLMRLFPKAEWRGMSLRMIFHGREVSQAKNPQYNSHPVWGPIYRSMEVKD